ncbi:hypothetical protein PSN45_002422 [Yamadazyma tenuis]|uniref:Uncharacterized protein n=1 Tax=Candida tenuis (strain ATCC 10573 / BCRC 21748 / CBS 615 / JCM 9827 / NBRC 10315 / NRRL Y-1498 / VKM Y-70) TaxID=590646 RepID=G3B0I5_CANTC|nr:uncharacterized protein CANTEDRAFT_103033 [Yamadazyma tenuis ATCC 10573]EGV65408.1 hypothetical protein CANTEDRAFT_103033 [Yamadazyma tenuis ATCC 10573]WEJ94920.1 hypothetical protein PSN45_002422 [Yamadazyma tenuis]
MLKKIDDTGSINKWIKWVVLLLVLRRNRAAQWAGFLSLNPVIKKVVTKALTKSKQSDSHTEPSINRVVVSQLSNLISSGLLFSAILDNPKIPSDYGVVYVFSNYIGELNPPSHSQILVTPKSSRYFKISYYNSPRLRQLYNHKQFLIFPLIFGQILSNYLTPTRYKLNQRYLSSSIKSRILNPIWINYSLGVNYHSLKWLGLLKSYFIHNLVFLLLFGVLTFKKRVVDHYYEFKHNVYNANSLKDLKSVVLNYVSYIFHRANSITNFIYLPNLISILLISLTAPVMRYIHGSRHRKLFFKSYIKVIGFIAGFVTLFANSMDLIPAFKYALTDYDDTTDSDNIRRISDGFFNGLSLYLLRLIVLQKWRILKENHPLFQTFKVKTWARLESLVLCVGIFKLMNLNDFLKNTNGKDYGTKQNSMIKLIDRIM